MTEEVVGVKEVEGRLLYECDKIESVCVWFLLDTSARVSSAAQSSKVK